MRRYHTRVAVVSSALRKLPQGLEVAPEKTAGQLREVSILFEAQVSKFGVEVRQYTHDNNEQDGVHHL